MVSDTDGFKPSSALGEQGKKAQGAMPISKIQEETHAAFSNWGASTSIPAIS